MPRAALMLLLCLPPASQAAEPPSSIVNLGSVVDGRLTDDLLWFEFSREDVRYALDPRKIKQSDQIFRALKASVATGQSVRVVFDTTDAVLDPALQKVVFTVRELRYEGTTYAGMRRGWSPPVGAGKRLDERTERQFIDALALNLASRPAEAIAVLDAMADPHSLPAPLARVFHKTRANAIADEISQRTNEPSDADDARLVRALADARRWAALAPNEDRSGILVGELLRDLGAYDDAVTHFQQLWDARPADEFWAPLRIASIHRTLGRNDAALATIDELGRRLGDGGKGMAWYYHRAWTLINLKRYEEAIIALDAGLASQPDYAGAFSRRACAQAALGRPEKALADFERAERLRADYYSNESSPRAQHAREHAQRVRAALRDAIARGLATPVDEPCNDSWFDERPRTRSPRLPDTTKTPEEQKA